MEFVAKLDDQISGPSNAAAAAQRELAAATGAADAQLKILDSTQQKAARRAELSAKAFNPKAYQQQILAERQLAAAKDKALEGLGLGLSQKEKDDAAAKSRKQAEDEREFQKKLREAETEAQREKLKRDREEEKAAEKKRQKTEQQKAAVFGLGVAAKAAAIGLLATAGAGGAVNLAQIAIGYQGMARLQTISYQASLQIRSLFRGVDSRPLERAYLQFTKLFSLSSTTGQGISKGLTRGFNGFFSAIEKAEPYVSNFVRGAYGGVLDLEYAWLRARVALLPLTDAIEDASGGLSGLDVAAAAGAAGVAALTGYAVVAAAPFIALSAAIGSVVAAADQLAALKREWDGDLILRSLGIGESDADRMNRQFDEEAAARKKAGKKSLVRQVDQTVGAAAGAPVAAPKPPVDLATGAGRRTGAAMGAGIVAGLKEQERALAAAGAAGVAAAQRGAELKADIHSPSRLFRREVGRQMGEGARLGLKDSEKGVQEQAAASLVPSPRVAGGGSSGAPAAGVVLQLSVGEINVGAGVQVADVRESFDEAMTALVQQVGVMLGAPRAGVANAG
jgi:hypothetical protein